jgi:hypothetical protein
MLLLAVNQLTVASVIPSPAGASAAVSSSGKRHRKSSRGKQNPAPRGAQAAERASYSIASWFQLSQPWPPPASSVVLVPRGTLNFHFFSIPPTPHPATEPGERVLSSQTISISHFSPSIQKLCPFSLPAFQPKPLPPPALPLLLPCHGTPPRLHSQRPSPTRTGGRRRRPSTPQISNHHPPSYS